MNARILLPLVLTLSFLAEPVYAQSFNLTSPINTSSKLTNISSPITRISTPTLPRITPTAPAPTPITSVTPISAPITRTPVTNISPVTNIPRLPTLTPIAPIRTPVTTTPVATPPVTGGTPPVTTPGITVPPVPGVGGLIDRPTIPTTPGVVGGIGRGVGNVGNVVGGGNTIAGNGAAPGLNLGGVLPGTRNGNSGNGQGNGNGYGLGNLLSNCSASRVHGVGAGLLNATCSNNGLAQGPVGQFALAAGGPGGVLISVSNQAQAHLVLFSSANQVMQGADGQTIAGEPGTLLDKSKGCVFLHTGRLTVSSGEAATEVQSKMGSIKLNPNVIAVVDQQVDRPLRVMALQGNGEVIAIKSHATGDRTITLKVGEELVLADSKLEEEDLIPADGLERVLVSGGIEKQSNMAKATFDVSHVMKTSRRSRAGRSVRLAGGSSPQLSAAPADAAQTWQAPEAAFSQPNSTSNAPAQIVAQPGSQLIQSANGNLNLALGMVLLQTHSDINVTTPMAHMELKKKAVAMIESSGETVRVKAMTGPGDIKIKAGKHTVELMPGEEVIVSDHTLSKAELNPQDAIARRIKSSQKLSHDLVISINDFSMVSMLRYPANRQAVIATDMDGTLLNRLMKIAAVVEIVSRGRGAYSYYQPDETVSVAQSGQAPTDR